MRILDEKPDIIFVLEATPQQVESVLKQNPTLFGEFAFVAEVTSVERPGYKVKLEREESGDSNIRIDSADVFHIARGRCLDLMDVGSLREDERAAARKSEE
jgi:hypothetical protein